MIGSSRVLASALLAIGSLCVLACSPPVPEVPAGGADTDWLSYGNDPGGSRHARVGDLTPANVAGLEVAWTANTGDVCSGPDCRAGTAFEGTPILVDGTLYACTPFNNVVALDPATGEERWRYDHGLDTTQGYANQMVCRGVESWFDEAAPAGAACRHRILMGTLDAQLVALDGATGEPCADFGENGRVDLLEGVGAQKWQGEYSLTSPPAIAGDLAIVGSAVSDGQRIDAPSGVVRAYDVRTGAMRWAFDPAPPGVAPGGRTPGGWARSSPNVWAPMAVDAERDLVFLPTGNPTPDYASAWRQGLETYGSSVVALRASTGELVWHFQTVHQDLWDFDVPSQPTLFELEREGERIPALVQSTKMGMLFTLHRETGEPLFPVEERPVPQAVDPGLVVAPTQPFPVKPPPLVPHGLDPADAFGVLGFDSSACQESFESLHWEGIYTPPSLQGSIMYPGNAGGSNWGGVAVHPGRQIVVANVQDLAWMVRLLPPEQYAAERAANPGVEISPQEGSKFAMRRELLLSPLGLPCNPPPWGLLVAVDMQRGEILWSEKLGTVRDIAPVPIPWKLGVPNLGGPITTDGGLVFIGAAMDDYLRAFDLATGAELWKGRLPAGGQATPMTYRHGGRQYVVIAAGGHSRAGTTPGDAIVAFALPN